MAGFIECKGENGEIIEVDIEENRTVSLETLRSLFGAEVSALTYTNPMSGRERVVRVADNKLLEPKDGWEFEDRIFNIFWIPMSLGPQNQSKTQLCPYLQIR